MRFLITIFFNTLSIIIFSINLISITNCKPLAIVFLIIIVTCSYTLGSEITILRGKRRFEKDMETMRKISKARVPQNATELKCPHSNSV